MNIAKYIDHTALKPETTLDDVSQLCREAIQYGFASVCVSSSFVSHAKEQLRGSDVKVCTVIGFPSGNASSAAKLYESSVALEEFADELDMVINVGRLKSGDVDYVRKEIKDIADCAHSYDDMLIKKTVKVIIETSLLTDDEKRLACMLAKEAGADFVKTSTGFLGGGATTQDIALMRSVVSPDMGVKASGGVSTYEQAKAMIDAGATRIGASKSIAIVTGAPKSDDGSY